MTKQQTRFLHQAAALVHTSRAVILLIPSAAFNTAPRIEHRQQLGRRGGAANEKTDDEQQHVRRHPYHRELRVSQAEN